MFRVKFNNTLLAARELVEPDRPNGRGAGLRVCVGLRLRPALVRKSLSRVCSLPREIYGPLCLRDAPDLPRSSGGNERSSASADEHGQGARNSTAERAINGV